MEKIKLSENEWFDKSECKTIYTPSQVIYKSGDPHIFLQTKKETIIVGYLNPFVIGMAYRKATKEDLEQLDSRYGYPEDEKV